MRLIGSKCRLEFDRLWRGSDKQKTEKKKGKQVICFVFGEKLYQILYLLNLFSHVRNSESQNLLLVLLNFIYTPMYRFETFFPGLIKCTCNSRPMMLLLLHKP